MKKLIFIIVLLFPLIVSSQTVRKIGPMEILDSGNVATWTNRNLQTKKVLSDTLIASKVDVAGTISAYDMDIVGDVKTKALYSAPTTITSGTDIDWSLGNVFILTPVAPTDYTFSNFTPGQIITVAIISPAPASTTFLDTHLFWPDGIEPVASSGQDVYTFLCVSATKILAISVLNLQ